MVQFSKLLFLLTCSLFQLAAATDRESYKIFRADGSPAALEELLAKAREAQVVFLGETHDDPVAHALELEIFQSLSGPDFGLSLEMFERDGQLALDEYLAGLITEETLISAARAWKNYKADYAPLIEHAKQNRIPVLAANAPRRYVNRVSRLGKASLNELSSQARELLPPLPYADASPAYAKNFKGHPGANQQFMIESQSLWDASMAFAIAETLTRAPEKRILQINGSFHSAYRLGIPEHLQRYRPQTKILVITVEPTTEFSKWDEAEYANSGDFVILTRRKKDEKK